MFQLKNKTESPQTETAPVKRSFFAELKEMLAAPGSAKLRRRLLLLLATFAVLIILIVVGTFAWYTRISTVTGLTMQAAEFDFNANYADENFVLKAEDYMNVANDLAAPGTSGVIPLRVSATGSEVGVMYTLTLDMQGMAPEFKQRIRYHYYDADGNVHNMSEGEPNPITGTLPMGTGPETSHYEYLYWEWVYELPREEGEWYYDASAEVWKQANEAYLTYLTGLSVKADPSEPDNPGSYEAFNKFDTDLSLGAFDTELESSSGDTYTPQERTVDGEKITITAYQAAMEVKLLITGAQAKPEEYTGTGTPPSTTGTPGTIEKPTG